MMGLADDMRDASGVQVAKPPDDRLTRMDKLLNEYERATIRYEEYRGDPRSSKEKREAKAVYHTLKSRILMLMFEGDRHNG